MKNLYKIIYNKETSVWELVETQTEQIMATSEKSNNPQFRELYNNLRGGTGFRGWTPPFFMNKIPKDMLIETDNI